MASQTPIPLAGLRFGYSQVEDRILAVFMGTGGGATTLLLTRRMVRLIVDRLAQMLDRSSTIAARAPAAMRTEVVQFEHQSAAAGISFKQHAEVAKELEEVVSQSRRYLVVRVELQPQGQGFLLKLLGEAGQGTNLHLQRPDLHRLLAALHAQARTAEWDLRDRASWLGPAAPTAEPSRLL